MGRAARDPKTGLTLKEEAFCLAYVSNGGNASAAYRTAYDCKGSKEATINVNAKRLLNSTPIALRLQALRGKVEAKVVARAAVDRAYVMAGIQEVAERCLQRAPVVDRKGNPVVVVLESGALAAAYTFEHNGANRALELLGKEIGMFDENRVPPASDVSRLSDEEFEKEYRAIKATAALIERSMGRGLAKPKKAKAAAKLG